MPDYDKPAEEPPKASALLPTPDLAASPEVVATVQGGEGACMSACPCRKCNPISGRLAYDLFYPAVLGTCLTVWLPTVFSPRWTDQTWFQFGFGLWLVVAFSLSYLVTIENRFEPIVPPWSTWVLTALEALLLFACFQALGLLSPDGILDRDLFFRRTALLILAPLIWNAVRNNGAVAGLEIVAVAVLVGVTRLLAGSDHRSLLVFVLLTFILVCYSVVRFCGPGNVPCQRAGKLSGAV